MSVATSFVLDIWFGGGFAMKKLWMPVVILFVAITGVPTTSDSTTLCGKFSQLDERIEASAAAKTSRRFGALATMAVY